MKLCKNYVEGISCPLNENCPNDHIDIRNLVKCEIDAQLKGNQWPLSSFGPFINKPSIPNYIEDLSFEEIRMMYYDSNTSFIQNAQKLAKSMKEAENKMEILMSMNIDVLEKLTDIYNYTVSTRETKTLQDLPNVQSPFGKSKDTKVIGTPVVPPFGRSATGAQPEINTNGTVFPLVAEKTSNVVQQSLFAKPQQPEKDASTDLNAQSPKGISPFAKTSTVSQPDSNTNCLVLKKTSNVVQQSLFANTQQPEKDTSTDLEAQKLKVISPFGKTTTGSQLGNNAEPEKASNVVKQPLFASITAKFEAQNQTAEPIYSAFKPLFTVPPPNKPLQLGFSSAPQLKFSVFGQIQKPEDQGLGIFGIPKQQKEPNFKMFSSVRPQEQKEQSLAQPKTGLFSFVGPSPRAHPLFDISKTQQKKNGFGVLGTKKPLEQSEHRFGFFNIAEPEKRQQPETNLSVFGVPKAQEQNKYSFGFFTSPEQEKLKNQENSFAFFKPPTIESSVVPKPAQLTYPSLFGFSTPQEKQNPQIGHSTDSELAASRKYEDIIAHFDALLREAIKRTTTSDCVKPSNAKFDNLENKTKSIPNVPLLIIKPKGTQTSEQTQTEVQDKIDPVELSVQIDTISKSLEGSIVIKCSNEESIITLGTEVTKKCGASYDVEVLHHEKDPQIVVHGIDNQVFDYKLIEIIRKQNKLNGKMNFVKSFEEMDNASKHSSVIEVDKNLYKAIMKQNDPSIYIGWNKCLVQDNFNISRCFSCWGFNHSAKTCSHSDKLVGDGQFSCTKYVPAM